MKKAAFRSLTIITLSFLLAGNKGFGQDIMLQKKPTPAHLLRFVKKAQVFSLDKTLTQDIINKPSTNLELQFQFEGKLLVLLLEEQQIFSKGFFVKDNFGAVINYDQRNAKHYRGHIKGKPGSVVAVNVYRDEMNAMIADETGNINIGPLENDINTMVVFRENDLITTPRWNCEAVSVPEVNNPLPDFFPPPTIDNVVNPEPLDIYYEADYSCYTGKGSNLTATINWVADLANNVNVLYGNDSILVQMSALKVWTVPDPFVSLTTTAAVLPAFGASVSAGFPGDLAHLLSRRGLGGGRAYLNVLCSGASVRTAVSGNLNNGITPLPNYSWNSMVITHEIGHNIVSNHTQWCGWPGGAIDNCYTTEGGCAAGPAPVTGGTIMSYCHLTAYGINLSNGFGPLPGAAVRNKIRTSTCIFPKVNFNKASETLQEELGDTENNCIDYQVINLKLATSYTPSQPVQIELVPISVSPSLMLGYEKDVELLGPLSFTLTDTIPQNIQLRLYDDAIIESNENFRLDFNIVANGTNATKGTLYNLSVTNSDHRPDSTINQLLFFEDFENVTLPGSWSTELVYGASSPNRWYVGLNDQPDFPNRSAFISNNGTAAGYSGSSSSDSTVVRIISPTINSTGFSNLQLSVSLKCLGEGGGGSGQPGAALDYGRIFYSGNGGTTWTLVRDNIWGRNSRLVEQVSLPTGASNNANLKLAFEWRNNSGVVNNPPLVIDSIIIRGTGPGPIQSLAHVANSDTAYLGAFTTVHFYNQETGRVMASIKNLSDFDFGCTQVDLIRTGTGAKIAWTTNNSDKLTDKVFKITSTNNSPTANYEVSLYATQEEASGWATATGNAVSDLRVIQSLDDIRTFSPSNPPGYGSSPSNNLFATNGDRIIKAVFRNAPWFSMGKPGIPGNCAADLKQFISELVGDSYQWQVDMGGGFVDISNNTIYSGASSPLLQLDNAPTNWYGYNYRCAVTISGTTTYSMAQQLKFIAYWKGTVNNQWHLAANWECGLLPDGNTDVFIPGNSNFNPVVSTPTSIRTLTVLGAATCTVNNNAQLNILK